MTDRKISELSAASALSGTEQVPIVQSGNTVRTTVADIAAVGVSASPGGSNTHVQFNDAGAFGGDAGFTYDKATNTITLGTSGSDTGIIRGSTGTAAPPVGAGSLTLKGGQGPAGGVGADITLQGGAGGAGIGSVGADAIVQAGAGDASFGQGGKVRLKAGTGSIPGNIYANGNGSVLSTSATGGFFEIPTCAGTPTGVPTQSLAGNVPLIYDTSANKLWVYSGTWKSVALT